MKIYYNKFMESLVISINNNKCLKTKKEVKKVDEVKM